MPSEGRAILKYENGESIIFAIHAGVEEREELINRIKQHGGSIVNQPAEADFFLFSTFVPETMEDLPRVRETRAFPVDSAWIDHSILSGQLKAWYTWQHRPLGARLPALPKGDLRDVHELAMCIATTRWLGIGEDVDIYKLLSRRYPHKTSQEFNELHQHQVQAIQTCVLHYVNMMSSFEPPPGCMFLPNLAPRLETRVVRHDTPRSQSGPVPFPFDHGNSMEFELSSDANTFGSPEAQMIRRQIGSLSTPQGISNMSHSHSAPPAVTGGASRRAESSPGKALSPTTISAAMTAVSRAIYNRPMAGRPGLNNAYGEETNANNYPPNSPNEARRDKGKGRLIRSSFALPAATGLRSPTHTSQSPSANSVRDENVVSSIMAGTDTPSFDSVAVKQEVIESSLSPPTINTGTSSALPDPAPVDGNTTLRRSGRKKEALVGPTGWCLVGDNEWARVTDLTGNPDFC